MITVVTLNPSVDRRYMIDGFKTGNVYRTSMYEATAGGKGLNVARVAHSLGANVLTTGLLGGKSGEFIEEKLSSSGIQHNFLGISGETRSCIAILSGEDKQTEILETGSEVTPKEIDDFFGIYDSILDRSSIIVGSGSLMKGMPKEMYGKLIEKAKQKKIPFLLDTSGQSLREGIKYQPAFIKPNLQELEDLIEKPIRSEGDVINTVNIIAEDNVATVMVTLGREGAVVIHKGNAFRIQIPKVNVKNPVGSGDSTVAGYAVAMESEYGFHDSIRFAMSCGIANAMEAGTGQVNPKKVEQIMKEVSIVEV